jgi:hypothetical protein
MCVHNIFRCNEYVYAASYSGQNREQHTNLPCEFPLLLFDARQNCIVRKILVKLLNSMKFRPAGLKLQSDKRKTDNHWGTDRLQFSSKFHWEWIKKAAIG